MDAAEVTLGVARGERPLEDLDAIGQRPIDHYPAAIRELRPPHDAPVVPVTWQDLALGFVSHYGKPSLEEWASYVVMAEFDFPDGPDDRTDDEERFVGGLYDASNSWPFSTMRWTLPNG